MNDQSKETTQSFPVKLKSSDGVEVIVDSKSAEKSKLLSDLIKDFGVEKEIPISEVKGDTLKKIVEYLEHYKETQPKELPKPLTSNKIRDVSDTWDADFIEPLDLNVIIDLINGAEFMNIEPLFLLTCARIACEMKGKTAEEVRKKFNIQCDLTEDEIKEFEDYVI